MDQMALGKIIVGRSLGLILWSEQNLHATKNQEGKSLCPQMNMDLQFCRYGHHHYSLMDHYHRACIQLNTSIFFTLTIPLMDDYHGGVTIPLILNEIWYNVKNWACKQDETRNGGKGFMSFTNICIDLMMNL
jgi:hypothetical protein